MKNFLLLEADNDPIINGGKTTMQSLASTTSNSVSVSHQKLPNAHMIDFLSTIFVYVALFFAAYWFFIRPHKKRQEKLADFQSKLQPGDNIVTTSGLHGRIIEIKEETFLVEFGVNKGIRIPINKNHIIGTEENEITQIQ